MRSSPNVANARRQVAALRAILLAPSPEALEQQVPGLEQAVRELETLAPGSDQAELQALAGDLRTAAQLIRHGLEFQQGWARLLASVVGGYQPDGEPSPLPASSGISLKG